MTHEPGSPRGKGEAEHAVADAPVVTEASTSEVGALTATGGGKDGKDSVHIAVEGMEPEELMEEAPDDGDDGEDGEGDHVKMKRTPLPLRNTIALCCVIGADAFSITVLFPFINQMVARFFHLEEDTRTVGYYSGYLAAVFFIAQCCTTYFWGWLSDRSLHKRILQTGLVFSSISLVLFGFSSSYWMALGVRVMWGMFNSNFPTAKSIIFLITDSSNRAKGFSLVGLMWGVGTITGPSVGGFASNRVWKDSYPYALPCLISAALSLASLLIMSLFLDQPHPRSRNISQLDRGEAAEEGKGPHMSAIAADGVHTASRRPLTPTRSTGSAKRLEMKSMAAKVGESAGKDLVAHGVAEEVAMEVTEEEVKVAEEGEVDVEAGGGSSKGQSDARKHTTVIPPGRMWRLVLFAREHFNTMVCMAMYSITALTFLAWDELFPLWGITSIEHGGLELTEEDIGTAWLISGIALIAFQWVGFAPITNAFGSIRAVQLGAILCGSGILLMPALNFVAESPSVVFWVSMAPILMSRAVSGALCFSSSSILVLNSTTLPVGKVNGATAIIGGIAKATGPLVATNMFALFATSGWPLPFNHYFTFLCVGVVTVVLFVVSLKLPAKIGFKAVNE